MPTPMDTMEAQLSAGETPSHDDMAQVLAQCLQERNKFEAIVMDLGTWMAQLVSAHMRKDAIQIKAILDDFIEKKVKVITNHNQQLH
ncbi:hypothetical protein KDM87_14515 [Undibacterium sp. FT147W]|uniref:Uncharacterized protein n=1 Tax=Undibacterium rivi TaxID=2828729 RepID=A0ABS5H4I3_9BURK|nr:hypothetical protein [Undibacterium rivi]MBR7793808.1 hypothetical protein [Undibacterium rivi]